MAVGFHILVLAGGSGTRLWPLSRAAMPKHLLPLGPGGEPLLRTTVDRVSPLAEITWVVTAAAQAAGCVAALEGVAADVRVIAEPTARGTGPAIGLAVTQIARDDPEAVIASVHADAHIGDSAAYGAAIMAAAGWASSSDGLATVGLTPRHPATGLGYIAIGSPLPAAGWQAPAGARADEDLLAEAAALPAHAAAGFVEKPSLERAEEFVSGGNHLWNLGLFAWPAARLLTEIGAADPGLAATLRDIVEARAERDDERADRLYAALAPVAIEPLVFERTSRLAVVRADFAWSDLGSWADLAETRAASADSDGNVVAGDALAINSRGCLVESRGGRTIAVVGVEGLIVVDTGDAVLVIPGSASQQVKQLVDELRATGRLDLL